MLKWECGMVVTLSEAKGLFSRWRCFASLSMTPRIPHSSFRIRTGRGIWSIE